MADLQFRVRWAVACGIIVCILGQKIAGTDSPELDKHILDEEFNWTRRPNADLAALSSLVQITQAFDNAAWPNVILKLDCRTDKGAVLPQALLGPAGVYTITPDISHDPTQCWSCAVRWEAVSRWNDFWVYSHGTCQMPLVCVQCLWNVDDKGFYLYNPELNEYIHIWAWNFPIPPDVLAVSIM